MNDAAMNFCITCVHVNIGFHASWVYASEGNCCLTIATDFNFLKNCHLILFWLPPQAQKISDDLMQKISTQNRRALDLVAAKCYYYHARVYEFLDKLDVVRRYGWPRVSLAALGVRDVVSHYHRADMGLQGAVAW